MENWSILCKFSQILKLSLIKFYLSRIGIFQKFIDAIVNKDELFFFRVHFEMLIEKRDKFLNLLCNIKLRSFFFTEIPMSYCNYQILLEIHAKYSAKNIDDTVKIFVKPILCSIKGNYKCIYILYSL